MAIKPKLTLIINSGNEEDVISDCLQSASFADELVFVAANSTDNTVKIAKSIWPSLKLVRVNDSYGKNFAKWHNIGLEHATGDWVFHLDCDERVTPQLRKEMLRAITSDKFSHYAIPRANHFLGKRVRHGGTYPDYVKRLFRKANISGWVGRLHEHPKTTGQLGYLNHDLLHYTHRHLNTMLDKTVSWTDVEAKALHQNNHPPIVWWRFIRMMLTKLFERLGKQSMWRDGTVGWISAIFETFDTFIIYARLWEIQQKDN